MSETWPTNAALHREHLQLLADHRETMVRLRDLRDEFRDFKRHAAANLASLNELVAELTAEVAKDPDFTAMVVGLLRALTFNLGGYEFRGERAPLDWDPDAEYGRMAGETEADQPAAPASRKRKLGPLDILDAFRTVTGWSDAEVLHYESCGECDPFASVACDAHPAAVKAAGDQP